MQNACVSVTAAIAREGIRVQQRWDLLFFRKSARMRQEVGAEPRSEIVQELLPGPFRGSKVVKGAEHGWEHGLVDPIVRCAIICAVRLRTPILTTE